MDVGIVFDIADDSEFWSTISALTAERSIADFKGAGYGYVQNLQGGIGQIIDSNGTVVVQ